MGQGTHKAEPWSPCVYRDAYERARQGHLGPFIMSLLIVFKSG